MRAEVVIYPMSCTRIDSDDERQDEEDWKTQWHEAVEATAGIAPHLEEGAEYVESVRCQGYRN